jgi:hypothetical protein
MSNFKDIYTEDDASKAQDLLYAWARHMEETEPHATSDIELLDEASMYMSNFEDC